MTNIFISAILASFALLAAVAIFRERSFDEETSSHLRVAQTIAIETITGSEKIDPTLTIKTSINYIQGLLNLALKNVDKVGVLHGISTSMRKLGLEAFETALANFKDKKHLLRKFFNRPLFFTIFTLLIYLIFRFLELDAENLFIYLLSVSNIMFIWVRFYNLFNFDYEIDALHGFEMMPCVYNIFLRPDNYRYIKVPWRKEPKKS